jgi:hypothetical protein
LCFGLAAQDLLVRSSGDYINLAAPKLRFIEGKPLDRIKNGKAVAFDFQISVLSDGRSAILRRNFERFVVSYDLWEEKFSVTRMRSQRASASRLSARAAEEWCVANMSFSSAGLPPDRDLWIRLDVRPQEEKERFDSDDPLSLANLIEIFSRSGRQQQPSHLRAEAGPLRLAELRRLTN